MLQVIFKEESKSLLHFLTNLCAIVGGLMQAYPTHFIFNKFFIEYNLENILRFIRSMTHLLTYPLKKFMVNTTNATHLILFLFNVFILKEIKTTSLF